MFTRHSRDLTVPVSPFPATPVFSQVRVASRGRPPFRCGFVARLCDQDVVVFVRPRGPVGNA
eukprot:343272-Lingulodinium_polyedra.AAC.1